VLPPCEELLFIREFNGFFRIFRALFEVDFSSGRFQFREMVKRFGSFVPSLRLVGRVHVLSGFPEIFNRKC
jgi:hypothetical protein